MKAIIEGRRFDTDTATAITEWSNNLGRGDFRDCCETLYVTKKGSFFLHGFGGPMTQWRRAAGNMQTSGEGILALTKEEARDWCEQHGKVDVIEDYFPETIIDA
jgi:hypothetical protein